MRLSRYEDQTMTAGRAIRRAPLFVAGTVAGFAGLIAWHAVDAGTPVTGRAGRQRGGRAVQASRDGRDGRRPAARGPPRHELAARPGRPMPCARPEGPA